MEDRKGCKYEVHLTFTVDAKDINDALQIGEAAGEHLYDTFNDNNIIDQIMRLDAIRVIGIH